MKTQLLHPGISEAGYAAVAPTDTSAVPFSPRLLTRILVPIDFSTASLRALRSAVALARVTQAAVHLLHVVEPPSFLSGVDASVLARSEPELASRTAHLLARLSMRHASAECAISSAVHIGKASGTITQVAEEMEADLVVLATTGRTGMWRILMGSVAERVIRCAPCPVMSLPSRGGNGGKRRGAVFDPAKLRKILVPVDFSTPSADAQRYAELFAHLFGAEITLLHCIDAGSAIDIPDGVPILPGGAVASTQRAEERLHEMLHQVSAGIKASMAVIEGRAAEQILAFANEGSFDLIICATHGRSGFKRAILGSTSAAVIRGGAPCPTITLNEWALIHAV